MAAPAMDADEHAPYQPPIVAESPAPEAKAKPRGVGKGEASKRGGGGGGGQHGRHAAGGAQEEGARRGREEAAGRRRARARARRVPGGAAREPHRERCGSGGVRGGVLRALRVPARGRALLRGARAAPRREAVLRALEAAAPAAARAGGLLVVLGRRGRGVPAGRRRPQAGNGAGGRPAPGSVALAARPWRPDDLAAPRLRRRRVNRRRLGIGGDY